MSANNKAAIYTRGPESRGKLCPYEEKFADLIKLCERVKVEKFDNLVIAWPWVLGDTYEEVLESLSRIASAGLSLHIVEGGDNDHRSIRGKGDN